MNLEERLIFEVKQYPQLYRKSIGGYKNMTKKFQIWNEIASKLSLTNEICQCKWKSLRDRYCRQYKKEKLAALAGFPTDHTEVWEHYEALQFLKPHIIPRNRSAVASIPAPRIITSTITSAPLPSISIKQENESPDRTTSTELDYVLNDDSSSAAFDSELYQPAEDPFAASPPEPKTFIANTTKKRKLTNEVDLQTKLGIAMDRISDYIEKKSRPSPPSQLDKLANVKNAFAISVANMIEELNPKNQIIARAKILQCLADLHTKEAEIGKTFRFSAN